jgi:basic membrane protein A and related proteins
MALLAATALVMGGAASGGVRTRPIAVGLVFQGTGIADPYQHGVLVGLQRAVRLLGVRAKTIASPPNQSSVGAFRYLAQHRYDLILTYGFYETADLDKAALQFPDHTFAIVDASIRDLKHRPKNVQGAHFETQQAAYLAGYLAALLELRRPGNDVLGSVGGYPIPTVDSYIAGYQAGARKAAPGIGLLNGYANSFQVPAKCRAVALNQIAQGAGAIFDVADYCGLGALAAARQRHVWGIGVDVDQWRLGPHILTSVLKRVDVAVFDTIKAYKEGKLHPGNDAVFDLENGGVGLGRYSRRVPQTLIARLGPIRAEIVAGRIEVPTTIGAK